MKGDKFGWDFREIFGFWGGEEGGKVGWNLNIHTLKTIFRDNKTVGHKLTVLKEPSPGVRSLCYSDPLLLF